MTKGAPASPVPDIAEGFRAAMRGVASTVTIVTAGDSARHHGMTATAVMPVSMDPPSLAIAINRKTLLYDILMSARGFCVNILDKGQESVSTAFSGALPGSERFSRGEWAYTATGLGYLRDAQASIFCSRAAALPYGTHSLFIGEVTDIARGDGLSPLLYLNAAYCQPLPRSNHN
ncbi:flavin reductase family protein [Sphingomonas sp. SRS2]|uniref:flavin reductase family protein n=1 Tax=Sphingomonas sp. SRS2 TaxID=133190 RepID=UPI0006183FC5|nr:flavin reductase family protein [Sphingomonas sp. SRS2]KKC23997.1 4-hydroxyphenylacetate 3-monooxygenase [Sphingomonas sp. SRS2]